METLAATKAEGPGICLTGVDLPDRPGAGEVRVRMLFAPVNPADLLSIDGRYSFPTPPGTVLGAEGAGTVEAVGAGVTDLSVGDLVLLLDRGNWCTHRQVRADRAVKAPPGMDPRRAAVLRINPPTAWLLLHASGAAAGDRIVQNAARSAVGAWVRAFAERRGIGVANLARGGGTTNDGAALAADIDALDGGFAAALDCVAGPDTGKLAARLDEGGRLIVFGHLSGEPATVPSTLLTARDLTVRGLSLRREESKLSAQESAALWADVWAAADRVAPEARIARTIALADLPDHVASGAAAGERVLIALS